MFSEEGTTMAGDSRKKLLAIAAKQDGIVSARDAASAGISYGAFRAAREALGWFETQPKTYATFSNRPSWRQRLRAAVVAAAPFGVVGGASAAALMKWPGFSEGEIVLITPRTLNRSLRNVTVHHSRDLAPDQVWRVAGFTVTRPARTLVDLSLTASDDQLTFVISEIARLDGNDGLLRLRKSLGSFAPQRAARVLEILHDRIWEPAGPESILETKLLRVLKSAGFFPTLQYEVRRGTRIIKRFDAAFVDKWVAIEADSERFHGAPEKRRRNAAQRNEARALGWDIIEVTDAELDAPENFLRAVHRALHRVPTRPLFSGEMPTQQTSIFDPYVAPAPSVFINEAFIAKAPPENPVAQPSKRRR